MEEALREAIRRMGGLSGMGRALGIARQAVMQWDKVPVMRVLDVERLTGVSRYRLRPDIYPAEPAAKS